MKGSKAKTPIMLLESTRRRLAILKAEMGFRTYNDAVSYLLTLYEKEKKRGDGK